MERPAASRPVSRDRRRIRYQLWLRPILGKRVHVFRRLPNVPIPPKPARRAKECSEFRLIGKPANRLDAPARSTDEQTFGMDMRRPGMKTVLIARPPHFGGTVAGFDAAQAQAVKGVDHVMQVDLDRGATGVAVVADGFWPARMGRDRLDIQWKAPAELPDSGKLDAQFAALLDREGLPARPGDLSGMAGAKKTITADFRFPFLAHAPMEPLNAVIELSGTGDGRRCDIWTGTRFQTIDLATVAHVLTLEPRQVRIHTMFAGGGFGRRATPTADYLADAATQGVRRCPGQDSVRPEAPGRGAPPVLPVAFRDVTSPCVFTGTRMERRPFVDRCRAWDRPGHLALRVQVPTPTSGAAQAHVFLR